MAIILKQQPTANTCVSACLAMLTGMPVELVVDDFHEEFENHITSIPEYLAEKGVIVKRTEDRQAIGFDKVYLLVVPSLNCVGQFHMVVCDTRWGSMDIKDPARTGSQRYVGHDAEPGETEIMSWIIDWEVAHAPAIGIIKKDK